MTREPIIRNFAPEEFPIQLTFVNPATTAGKELNVWNTGLSAAGEPHFSEGNKGEAIVPTEGLVQNPKILKNAFELRLYRTNEFITLIPGDQVVMNVYDSKELAYYLSIPDGDLFTILERDTYVQNKTVTLPEVRENSESVTATVNFTPVDTSKYVWTVNGEVVEGADTATLDNDDLFVKDDILTVTIEGVTAKTTVLEAST